MRLIDADELIKDLTKWFPQFTLEGIEAKTLFNQILHDIDNAPTVDRQAINAEWLKAGIEYAETHRPQGECEKCDFRKFTETFIDGVVDVMNKNGITSIEQLSEILKGGSE